MRVGIRSTDVGDGLWKGVDQCEMSIIGNSQDLNDERAEFWSLEIEWRVPVKI
jgi:hypothetical protein